MKFTLNFATDDWDLPEDLTIPFTKVLSASIEKAKQILNEHDCFTSINILVQCPNVLRDDVFSVGITQLHIHRKTVFLGVTGKYDGSLEAEYSLVESSDDCDGCQ